MLSEESWEDSRGFLKEIIRSNGHLGRFWVRGTAICVQVRHPVIGDVRLLVDPNAFRGRGCIYEFTRPKHLGDPFGWRRIDFREFAGMMKPTIASRLSMLRRGAASEVRNFTAVDEKPRRVELTASHLVVADRARPAAVDYLSRLRHLTDRLRMDGNCSLSESLNRRGSAGDPLFPADLLSLHDLLGEAIVFRSLFGRYLDGQTRAELDRAVSVVEGEIIALCGSLKPHSFDMALLYMTAELLDGYLIDLGKLTSKLLMIPALTRAAMTSQWEEVYYALLETRTMAENIFAATTLTGHPPSLSQWIAEFRRNDYALREVIDRLYTASPSVHLLSPDMSVFFRDRFGYPPEVFWWMWHGVERGIGRPLSEAFGFDHRAVREACGLDTRPVDVVAPSVKPGALVGKHVEILMVRTSVGAISGKILGGLEVTDTCQSEFDEDNYFLARFAEPLTIPLGNEMDIVMSTLRFGSPLPRTPPQIIADAGFASLMRSDPYRRVAVDVSFSSSETSPDAALKDMTFIGFGMLGLVEAGQPSVLEVQRYRLVQEFVEKAEEEAKAWDMDYMR